jgi:uncharacterized protein (TIGR03032 family)
MSSLPTLEITASRQFTAWLAEQRVSLAFTTYQTGKLFLIGLQSSGELSVFERTFNRAMGLYASPNQLYLSSLYQLWQFENALKLGQLHEGYDHLYVPQVGYTTGDLDIHDIALNEQGQILFVNTLFSCLATISKTHSFIPLWHPPFISKLAAEDRCHLNGLAMQDGKPRYMTAIAQTDVADGWRDRRQSGGCVIDIESNEIVATELSMPHSPRWHLNQLWLLNSGTGDFGKLDLNGGKFQPLTFCPGYLRGLAFSNNFAVVGLSKPRHNKTFSGLALDEILTSKNADARAGLQVIDLNSGDAVHWLRIEGMIEEMYDVVALPNVRCPMALGFKSDEIRRVITIGDRQAVTPKDS